MHIREYSLPNGWYPREADSVAAFLSEFSTSVPRSRAVIAPHAGWYYSGKTAAVGVASLTKGAETIVILGGHLSSDSPPLFAMEDAVRTPFGAMELDAALRSSLLKELGGAQDRYRDNTIEVLLPMAHYFFPNAKLLWLRLPASIDSYESGKIISQVAAKLKININVLASTDLTHYGRNYGFSPQGSGKEALRWVREVNDAGFIKAVEDGDGKEVLRRAELEHAACSAGAVLGAMGFANAKKLGNARLLQYATSADMEDSVPDSFVGYASFAFGD